MIFFLILLGLVSWTAFAKQYLNSPYSADQPSYNSKRVLRRLEILEEKDLEKNEIIKMLKNEIFVLKQMVNKAQERSKTLNNESNRKKDTPKKGIRHQVMDLKDENPGKNSTTDKDYESDAKSDTKRNKTADHVGSMILQTRDDSDVLNQVTSKSMVRRMISEHQVAFFALLTPHDVRHHGINQPVVFDNTVLNLGNSYHIHHGIFTAPYDGIYSFTATIFGRLDEGILYFGLTKNGICCANFEIKHSHQVTQTVILDLQKGDYVAVTSWKNDQTVVGHNFSSFSGFLLFEKYQPQVVVG